MTQKPFDKNAIPKCRDRLEKARKALFNCRGALNAQAFTSHWSSFLIETGGVLNALDAGAKGTAQGRQWYGGIKRAGRSDPLVSYMHQSRNAEEHTLDATTNHEAGSIKIGMGESVYIKHLDTAELARDPIGAIARGVRPLHPGGTVTVKITPSGPVLAPVKDQFGTVYKPPSSHQGKKIHNQHPVAIGELWLTYLEDLIQKASALA